MRKPTRWTTKPVAAATVTLTLAAGSILGLPLAAHASTTKIAATVTVGSSPINETADNGTVYVSNLYDKTVSVIDESTDAVTATVAVGNYPRGLVAAAGDVYVANYNDNTVSVIDESKDVVVATIDVGTKPRAITAGGRNVYVSNQGDDTVSVIDESTGKVTATYTTTAVNTDSMIASAGYLYIAGLDTDNVDVLNESTGADVGSIDIYNPLGLAAFDGVIYVSSVNEQLYKVDQATGKVGSSVMVGGTPSAISIANGLIYVTNSDDASVSVINVASFTADQTVTVGSEPSDAVADRGEVFVANLASGTVSVLDGSPASPTGLAAFAGNGKVELIWNAVTEDGGSPVTHYKVYAATKSGRETKSAAVCTTTKTSCLLSGLKNRTVYYFVVESINSIGASDPSHEISTEPHGNPTLKLVGLKATTESHGAPVYQVAKGARHRLTGLTLNNAKVVLQHGTTQVATTKASSTGVFTITRKLTVSGRYYVLVNNQKSNVIGIVAVPLTLKVSGSSRPGKHKLSGAAPAGSTVQLLQDGKVVAKTMASKHSTYIFSRKVTATHRFQIKADGVRSSTFKVTIG